MASAVVEVIDVPVYVSSGNFVQLSREGESHLVAIDFDAVTARAIAKMPVADAGIGWENLVVVRNDQYGGEGYMNNTRSGSYVGYNSSGYPVSLTAHCDFDFIGAFIGVAWQDGEGEALHISAWRDDLLISRDTIRLSSFGPIWYDARLVGVSRVEFRTENGWQFVIDEPQLKMDSSCLETIADQNQDRH